jgi:hypothetical protein
VNGVVLYVCCAHPPQPNHTMAADSCAPCDIVHIHPGAHAPLQAGSWSGRPVGELGSETQARTVRHRQKCAERPLATCCMHHDGGKDGGVQEERLPTNRSAETKLACSRRGINHWAATVRLGL